MMSHLYLNELTVLADSIYVGLFGKEMYGRWQTLKQQSNCDTEKHFMSWILDVVESSMDSDKDLLDYTLVKDKDKEDCKHSKANSAIEKHQSEVLNLPNCKKTKISNDDESKSKTCVINLSDNEGNENGDSGEELSIYDDICSYNVEDKQALDTTKKHSSIHKNNVINLGVSTVNMYEYLSSSLSDIDKIVETKDTLKVDLTSSLSSHVKTLCKFNCNMCNATFKTKTSAVRHRVTVHTTQKTFTCSYCSAVFCTRKDRVDHEKAAHGNLMKYNCNFCDKKFFRKDRVVRHENIIHLGLKKFACNMCQMAFPTRFNLRDHVTRVHIGSKRYQCPHCAKSLADKTSYLYHLNSFHKEK